MKLIDNQKDFDQICKKFSSEKLLYIDTEFSRRRTYYAKLSIVQIASKSDKVIIDKLSGINIAALKSLLADENIIKVFHAPEQDFDIFFQLFNELPKNVFDTQIAAGVAGLNYVMGYGNLCRELLNINLDKTMQTANWLARPLTKSLIDYAIKDVEYLIPLHRVLSTTITDRNLWDAYNAQSQKLLDTNTYIPCPKRIMKRMKTQTHSKTFQQNLLHLIALREECSQKLDIPRSFSMPDQDLLKVCQILPTTMKELSKLRLQGKLLTKIKFTEKLLSLCSAIQEF